MGMPPPDVRTRPTSRGGYLVVLSVESAAITHTASAGISYPVVITGRRPATLDDVDRWLSRHRFHRTTPWQTRTAYDGLRLQACLAEYAV